MPDAPNPNLDLGIIGNCSFNALIDRRGCVVWSCMPRPDSDPVFNALLSERGTDDPDVQGIYDVHVDGPVVTRQRYETNTAVLVTEIEDAKGQVLEIVDFAPRFSRFGRRYRPVAMVRLIRPVKGTPQIRIRLRPTFNYGADRPRITHGSNHVRYVSQAFTLRLTTDVPITYIVNETAFRLERPLSLFLGPDESLTRPVIDTTGEFLDYTVAYWREWVRSLALPFEWQDAVIRAAITLKLCWFEETGGIIAAMTTSIPESPNSGRNWDYRFCWLRDAYYVIRALNRLGAIDILESYLVYLRNLPALTDGAPADVHVQPVYGIGLEHDLHEREVTTLPGYRGMGPVRIGNQAFQHFQHDVYGQVVLSAAQAFYDRRLLRPLTAGDFRDFENLGERAYALHEAPDAGLWELRTKSRVHTYSSLLCWAACDRLERIAAHLDLPQRAALWRERAGEVGGKILTRAWNAGQGHFASSFGGGDVDASLMQMAELGLVAADDPRFTATLEVLEKTLWRNNFMFRYVEADDFGVPAMAFNICTFWYIDVLHLRGEHDRARALFQIMLECRNPLGLMSEHIDAGSREQWGNYPQTYALVGVINTATRLSRPWSEML